MSKFNKDQAKNVKEIEDLGGAVLASNWITGSGNFISKRTIPPFCERMEMDHALTIVRGVGLKTLKKIQKNHPKCKFVVAIVDLRGARKLIKTLKDNE